jgi:hypothetical protein
MLPAAHNVWRHPSDSALRAVTRDQVANTEAAQALQKLAAESEGYRRLIAHRMRTK